MVPFDDDVPYPYTIYPYSYEVAESVVLEGDVNPCREIDRMIDIITEINLEYNVLISVYPVSEKNYNSLNSPLLLNIRKEGVAA